MTKIRFTDTSTGTKQDADAALPINAAPYGGSGATVRPKVFRTASATVTIPAQNRTPPVIMGPPGYAQTLYLAADWDGATAFSYEWYSNGALVGSSANYVPQLTDQGKTITARMQATGSAWVDATNSVFIPTVTFAVVLDTEWQATEAVLDTDTREAFARVDDTATDGFEFCAAFSAPANVTAATPTPMTLVESHYEAQTTVPYAVGGPQARTVVPVRIMERLISDPTNTAYWRWVSEVKTVTISSVPTAPAFTAATGADVGEITINRTVKADGSGRPVTADYYRLNGGSLVLVPGDLEIGARTITGLTAGASYTIEFLAENVNGQSAFTSSITATAGTAIVAPTTTTLTFPLQQVVASGTQTVVTHIDGPKCIVSASPVTINSISTATVYTLGAVRNGAMLNPVTTEHAFDDRATFITRSKLVTFPVTLNPGDILLLAVSQPESPPLHVRNGGIDEYNMVYVAASAPNPLSLAPAAIGWTGRGTPAAGPVVDYLAKAALLPTTYDLTAAWTYPTGAQIDKALRFNPAFALTAKPNNAAAGGAEPYNDAGYERMIPSQWATPHPTREKENYGAYLERRLGDYAMYLTAPVSKVSLANKANILMRMHSFAFQCLQKWIGKGGPGFGANGGHYQFHQTPIAIAYWLMSDTSGLDTLKTNYGGNWLGYFRLTEEMVPEWFEPWGDVNDPTGSDMSTTFKPHFSRQRKIIAVDAVAKTITIPSWASGTTFGATTKTRWGGLYVTLASNPLVTARVQNPPDELDWPSSGNKTLTLDTWPGFAVNDVIYAKSPGTHTVGDAEWRVEPYLNRYNPAAVMSYRKEANPGYAMMFLRILGLHRDDWQPIWDYVLRCEAANTPAVEMDYGTTFDGQGYSFRVWAQYSEVIKTVAQPSLSALPGADPFYPDVADVNLMVDGSALKFPEGNFGSGNTDSGLKIYKGALAQTNTNIPGALASSAHQAVFAIVRLPKDKQPSPNSFGVFGNSGTGGSRTYVYFAGGTSGNGAFKGRFVAEQSGASGVARPTSALWTEDTALVVLKCDAANQWMIDWYSLATGTKFAGTAVSATTTASSGLSGSSFGIGANIMSVTSFSTNTVASGLMYWPGEMEAFGMVRANISDASWTAIAQGADIITTLGAANVPYLKTWDAATATLKKPASASSDTSPDPVPLTAGADPVAVPASRLLPGSTIRRQSQATYFTIDLLSEGWVYGLNVGQTKRLVPFAGTAAGYTGNVEVRVYDSITGDVVRDWTVAGAISAGVWSGNIELPKGNGWWFAEARVASSPTVKAYRRTEFSVGWKFLCVGQSQMQIALGTVAQVNASVIANTHPQSYSYVSGGTLPSTYLRRMSRVGTSATQTVYGPLYGLHWFANQFRMFDPSTPFMVIDEAMNGTGMRDLYNDNSPTLRTWANFQDKIDAYGSDVTAVVHNWASSDGNATSVTGTTNTTQYKERMDALFFGTGAAAGAHNLRGTLPDAVFSISPTTRRAGNSITLGQLDSSSYDQLTRARTQCVEWAHANSAPVGPPVSDFRIENTGGPHQQSGMSGSGTFCSRMAITFARALGLDASTNPYFTTAAFNGGRTTITVSVALTNGGTLYSPAPTAVRSFEVQDGGTGGWVATGFTAAVVSNTVVLTKDSGAWLVGTKARYISGLENRVSTSTDSTLEDTIIAGALYETWNKDVVKPGGVAAIPLLGSLVAGDWYPDWSVTVS